MNQNALYAVIAILLVGVVVLGVMYFQQQQAQPGLEIRVDGNGIAIEGNG